MGRKSSSAAKERRAAQRAADREQQQHEAVVAEVDGTVLEGYEAAVGAAIPQLPASMVATAVDVLCRRVSAAYPDENNEKTLAKLEDDINESLGKEAVWDIYTDYYKMPYTIVMEAMERARKANNNDTKEKARLAKQEAKAAAAPEVVLLADRGQCMERVGPSAQGPKTQRPKVHQKVGPKDKEPAVQGHTGTLGFDLGGRIKLSKPRSLKVVDEIMWAAAQQLAIEEVAAQYGIEGDVELYYSNMCRVGQQAVAAVINIKTQSIYDARCAQRMSREKRKCKQVVAA